jgi:hypothetical protein
VSDDFVSVCQDTAAAASESCNNITAVPQSQVSGECIEPLVRNIKLYTVSCSFPTVSAVECTRDRYRCTCSCDRLTEYNSHL